LEGLRRAKTVERSIGATRVILNNRKGRGPRGEDVVRVDRRTKYNTID